MVEKYEKEKKENEEFEANQIARNSLNLVNIVALGKNPDQEKKNYEKAEKKDNISKLQDLLESAIVYNRSESIQMLLRTQVEKKHSEGSPELKKDQKDATKEKAHDKVMIKLEDFLTVTRLEKLYNNEYVGIIYWGFLSMEI